MNIDDLQHNSFEEQWQNAFDDASMTPPEGVWEKIEVSLDNNIQPKSGNQTYYWGAVSALILSIALWYFVGNKEEIKPFPAIENKRVVVEKKEEILSKTNEIIAIKPKERIATPKVIIPKEETIVEPQIVEIQTEKVEKILIDSVDFITPISPKQIPLDFTTTTPDLQHEQTPYYEKPKPKPKKKPIFRNVRISGGIGVYQ
ncbi:hypothetical protein LV89_00582 [Arcicella aurantiaca]|uniref:Uncharacterized protein n=1 Tax=Arcicella aurantiaca TaxID=591202 RepID=A0A316EH39_9BACT|nr:hypothetical protein [Arcicella aurantiaca]PWK29028.1 hypothetical protein LV89_00582 [Arcicella aurantiaca]